MDNSGAMKCPVCKSTPTDFKNNNMEKFNVPVTITCLSQTHYGINAFQNIFKIGFNSDFKKYKCTAANKTKQETRKAKILKMTFT